MDQTPIEVITGILDQSFTCEENGGIIEVLVPEQCALIVIGDKTYHITIEEV